MTTKKKKLKKAYCFTDIHLGIRGNAEQSNQDCVDFIKWFCDEVRKDKEADHIVILGDFFENRNALNVLTIDYAIRGIKLLSELNLPVYILVGNHDLYFRHSRDITSLSIFDNFPNINVIKNPTVIEEIGDHGALMCPYLFHDEYPKLKDYLDTPVWWGHFEFRGFVITGYNIVMPTGPTHEEYKSIKRIFSGHFHKRQTKDNTTYIGNAFPTNFADSNDARRGITIYDYDEDNVSHRSWPNQPMFHKIKLSTLLESENVAQIINKNSRVRCIVDVPITFEESITLKASFIKQYNLREFSLEESNDLKAVLNETEADQTTTDGGEELPINQLITKLLKEIKSETVKADQLVTIFVQLHEDLSKHHD